MEREYLHFRQSFLKDGMSIPFKCFREMHSPHKKEQFQLKAEMSMLLFMNNS